MTTAGPARHQRFYRYVGSAEAFGIATTGIVQSLGPITWYTPNRYATRITAKRYLALPALPTHRVGPVPEDEMPVFTSQLRRVQPGYGEPGGGWEAGATSPLYLLGLHALS